MWGNASVFTPCFAFTFQVVSSVPEVSQAFSHYDPNNGLIVTYVSTKHMHTNIRTVIVKGLPAAYLPDWLIRLEESFPTNSHGKKEKYVLLLEGQQISSMYCLWISCKDQENYYVNIDLCMWEGKLFQSYDIPDMMNWISVILNFLHSMWHAIPIHKMAFLFSNPNFTFISLAISLTLEAIRCTFGSCLWLISLLLNRKSG